MSIHINCSDLYSLGSARILAPDSPAPDFASRTVCATVDSRSPFVALAPVPPNTLLNISTRLQVLTDDKVLTGGFIVDGDEPKTAILRAIGPALADFGISGALVEVYDLDATAASELANISRKGFVEVGNNVMIGGFILSGETGGSNVLIRAIGPSLTLFGVAGALADPSLELHDGNGTVIGSNNNWQESQQDEIEATGLAPQDDLESALLETLEPGAYTAIVTGQGGGTGVALVEVYRLP
jgi:hypothetical protein